MFVWTYSGLTAIKLGLYCPLMCRQQAPLKFCSETVKHQLGVGTAKSIQCFSLAEGRGYPTTISLYSKASRVCLQFNIQLGQCVGWNNEEEKQWLISKQWYFAVSLNICLPEMEELRHPAVKLHSAKLNLVFFALISLGIISCIWKSLAAFIPTPYFLLQ